MNLRERIKQECRVALLGAELGIVAGLGYAGLALGAGGFIYGTKAALEMIEQAQPHAHVATFETARYRSTPAMDRVIGTFTLEDGTQIQLNDNAWVTRGKWSWNRTLPTLQEGRQYNIETIGSWTGETLLSATPLEK